VFNVGGDFYALLNRRRTNAQNSAGASSSECPNPKCPSYQLSRPGEILRCRWHGWEFDLGTGKSHCDPQGLFTRQYKPSVERETSSPDRCGDGGLTAETFPGIVEEAVVFIEV